MLDKDNNLVPLHPLPPELESCWGAAIGLGNISPAEVLPPSITNYADASKFIGPTFITGQVLEPFKTEKYTLADTQRWLDPATKVPLIDPETDVPLFAKANWREYPISCAHSSILQAHAAAKLGYSVSGSRASLEKTVRGLLSNDKPILPPERVPMQIGWWMVHEVLENIEGQEWEREPYFDLIQNKVAAVDSDLVQRFYPKKNESNRQRALRLAKEGNVDVQSIELKYCKSRVEPELKVLLSRSKCVPSMKTEVFSRTMKVPLKRRWVMPTWFIWRLTQLRGSFSNILIPAVAVMMAGPFARIFLQLLVSSARFKEQMIAMNSNRECPGTPQKFKTFRYWLRQSVSLKYWRVEKDGKKEKRRS